MSGAKVNGKYVRLSVGRCEACNRELQESEMYIKGSLSNVELGLCRKCAQFVNDPLNAQEARDEAQMGWSRGRQGYDKETQQEPSIASLFDSV